jgi:DNA (cytosine-5)-methyltransferase 1
VAWHPLGWEPAFFSEIDKFPCAMLRHHYQQVPNLGDMNGFKDWPDATINVLVGGTPCQSFSVAGLRKGLADPRGNLALVYLAIADRFRPSWLVWENVPGVLSSNGGRDFGAFLGGLGQLGYGWAYRVLDAQYVRVDGLERAVPQRRRRVFVVGYLGDWRRAAAVLFERESLFWDSAPRREEGQKLADSLTVGANQYSGFCGEPVETVAPTIASRTRGGGGLGTDFDCDGGLIALDTTQITHHPLAAAGHPPTIAFSCKDAGADAGEIAPTLRAMGHDGSHANAGGQIAVAFAQNSRDELVESDVMLSLKAGGGKPGQSYPAIRVRQAAQGESHADAEETDTSALLRRVREAIGAEALSQWGLGILDQLQPPEILRSALHGCELRPASFSRRWVVHCALSREKERAEGAVQSLREAQCSGCPSQGPRLSEQCARELGAYLSELSQPGAQAERFLRDLWLASEGLGLLREALSAAQEARRPTCREGQPAHTDLAVRRLTVEECEFLMGYPRGYTAVPYGGKPASDGPRYKALGNSMAVNVVRWLGQRIHLVERRQ